MTGDPPPAEMRAFVLMVTKLIGQSASPDASKGPKNTAPGIAQATPIPSGRGLFFTLSAVSRASFSASRSGLFLPLKTVGDSPDLPMFEA